MLTWYVHSLKNGRRLAGPMQKPYRDVARVAHTHKLVEPVCAFAIASNGTICEMMLYFA